MRAKRILSTAALCLATFIAASAIETPSASASATGAQAQRMGATYNVGQIYIGGNLGMGIPTAIGRNKDQVSFKDVAKLGFSASADAMRLMNQSIGLGGEVFYQTNSYNEDYWSGISRYGSFENKYQTVGLNLTGRVFISTKALRPFIGIGAGGALVHNSMDFQPNSKSSFNQPVNYTTNNISPVFGVMTGIYNKIGKRTLLSIQIRLNVITKVKDDVIPVDNADGANTITQNAHGNQNNIMVTLGLHIGSDRKNQH